MNKFYSDFKYIGE